MANITEYIKWRGDISFEDSPLCDVDSLIFCELSYIPYELVLKDNKNGETLEELWNKFVEIPEDNVSLGAIIPTKSIRELFCECAKSRRYKGVKLKYYINEICKKAEKQFCAMCFSINREYYYIAYRGTDDNLVSWKENLNMAHSTPIPAQKAAASYLDNICIHTRRKIYVGGHSKGGNLAAYAGIFCSERAKNKIISVHSFDGPGFESEFLQNINNEKIKEKTTTFLPKGAIIGAIFDHYSGFKYIETKAKGLYQHDGFLWDVLGTNFVTTDGLIKSSSDFHDLLSDWTKSLSIDEKIQFVETLYKLMTENNFETLTDIGNSKLKFFFGIIKSDIETKKILYNAITKLIKEKYKKKPKEITEKTTL